MNENEKYGVEVVAETSKFKKAMQDLASFMRKFGKQAEQETTIAPKIDYQNEINLLKKQADEYEKKIKELQQNAMRQQKIRGALVQYSSGVYEFANKEDTQKYQDLIDKQNEITQKIQDLESKKFFSELPDATEKDLEYVEYSKKLWEDFTNELNEAKDDINEVNDETKELDKNTIKLDISVKKLNLGGMFDKSIGKIKRFTFYLLGARSVFSLFMKYQSIYYQYNEQMQYQSELSQNAIALSLAPAFELLGNVIAYASIGFAKFIELLTGINVLSKVTTKGIRDYNKSLKETQTLVSGIDEITNLNLPSSTGLAGQYKALDEFQKKIKEVEEWIKKNTWVQDIVDGLKTAYNFISDNWDIFKYIFAFLGFGVPGVFVMAGGLKGIINDIKAIKEMGFLDYMNKVINDVPENLKRMFSNLYEYAIKPYVQPILDKWKKDLEPIWQPFVNGFNKALEDKIKPMWNDFIKPKLIDPISEKLKEFKNVFLQKFGPFLNEIIYYYNISMGKIFGQIDYLETKFDETADSIENNLGDINDKADNMFKDKNVNIKYIIDANITKAKNSLNELFKKFNLGGILSGSVPNSIADFFKPHAKGLDYVPYDEYPALLHKGEAVVPAKYNPTIHSQGNEYTNSLLETLVIKMDDLARRPNEFIIDGQKFANATYPLYENAKTQQNYVEGVVR